MKRDLINYNLKSSFQSIEKDTELITKAMRALMNNELLHNKDIEEYKNLLIESNKQLTPTIVKFVTHLYNKIEKPGIQLSKLKEEILKLNEKICK